MQSPLKTPAFFALTWLVLTASEASAQVTRAPSKPPSFSLDAAWHWLAAKPGALIAVGIALVALVWMFLTRERKSKG
jgi:hypothetical protein